MSPIALNRTVETRRLNILKFLSDMREKLTIVLATASSDAVLPQIMRKLERMGVKEEVVGLVIPTGYSFNLDAFSIYLTLATVFIAQATNTPLSLGDCCSCRRCRSSPRRAPTACLARPS
jgi:Na+/H+-dicarboxylate symporter